MLKPLHHHAGILEFIASKPDKNGMKIYWICDSTTIYPLKAKPYFGNKDNAPQRGLAQNIVLKLSLSLHRSDKNIALDNCFTDTTVTVNLLQKGFTFVGTFLKNKAFVAASFLPSRRHEIHSSVFGFQKNATLMSYMPKKNKCKLILSSMHHNAVVSNDKLKKIETNL